MSNAFPKLVAFDLDYTLWDLWIDTNITGPLKRKGNALNTIEDRHGETISFYHEVPQILHRLRAAEVTVAACSRTSAPKLAREALSLLLVPTTKAEPGMSPEPAINFFDQAEIYPGSKIRHFQQLHRKTGIPYSQMLFFDDEHRNKEVEKLGVTFCLVHNGVDEQIFERGLALWRTKEQARVVSEEEAENQADDAQ